MKRLRKPVLSGLLLCFILVVPGLAAVNTGVLVDTTLTGGECTNLGIIANVSPYIYGIRSPNFNLFNAGSGAWILTLGDYAHGMFADGYGSEA